MNKVSIKDFDVNNGDGIRVSLWVSGCEHKCDGCHNSHYWDKSSGTLFTDKDLKLIIDLLEKDISKDFSILGGEPLTLYNIPKVTTICKKVKSKYPEKSIWIWTGYDFDDIKHLEVMNYIDILIDGKFIEDLKDEELMWCGSSNQRIIDVKESLKQNKVILYNA